MARLEGTPPLPTYAACKEKESNSTCVQVTKYEKSIVKKAEAIIKGVGKKKADAGVSSFKTSSLNRKAIFVEDNLTRRTGVVAAIDKKSIERFFPDKSSREYQKALSEMERGNDVLVYIDPQSEEPKVINKDEVEYFCLQHPVKDTVDLGDLSSVGTFMSSQDGAIVEESALKISILCENAEFMSGTEINALYDELLKQFKSFSPVSRGDIRDEKANFLKEKIQELNGCFADKMTVSKGIKRKGHLQTFPKELKAPPK